MYVFMKENSDSGNENEVVNRSQLKAEWFIILFRLSEKMFRPRGTLVEHDLTSLNIHTESLPCDAYCIPSKCSCSLWFL